MKTGQFFLFFVSNFFSLPEPYLISTRLCAWLRVRFASIIRINECVQRNCYCFDITCGNNRCLCDIIYIDTMKHFLKWCRCPQLLINSTLNKYPTSTNRMDSVVLMKFRFFLNQFIKYFILIEQSHYLLDGWMDGCQCSRLFIISPYQPIFFFSFFSFCTHTNSKNHTWRSWFFFPFSLSFYFFLHFHIHLFAWWVFFIRYIFRV